MALFLEDPDSFALRLKAESQNVIERAKAFGKHKTPAESVNCFDGGTYEDFVREYSGEAAALLAMLNSEDPIKIESWIHHVFSVASGPYPPLVASVLARGRVVRGPWGWRPLWQRPLFHL